MIKKFEPESIDEFRDWIDKLYDEVGDDPSPSDIIRIAKIIFNKSRNLKLLDMEKVFFKKNYITQLLVFGYRYKGQWEDGGRIAQNCFEDALKVESNIPIAHYRLGHIHFKLGNYGGAVNHLYSAINQMDCLDDIRYTLEDYQLANARKILTTCALEIFEKCKSTALDSNMYPELDTLINAYRQQTNHLQGENPVILWLYRDGKIEKSQLKYCKYRNLKIEIAKDSSAMFIDHYDSQPLLSYQYDYKPLGPVLLRLLLDLIEGVPQYKNEMALRERNNLNQKLGRIRDFLLEIGLNHSDFKLINLDGKEPSIFINLAIYIFKRIEE